MISPGARIGGAAGTPACLFRHADDTTNSLFHHNRRALKSQTTTGSLPRGQLWVCSPEVDAPNTPWCHFQITLQPLNRDHQPNILTAEDECQVRIIAEVAQML